MDADDESSEPTRVSHYRLQHSLGSGGMGEVFAAFDETLKRRVAIKAIHAQRLISADTKARFLREAQILSRLDHPHICRVHDYISEGGRDYLVLELIEGKSLRTAIQAGLDRATAMSVARQIADVLIVTHAAGIVHRDLKPGNVMINGRGEVKVLDFGLARPIDVPSRTASGAAPAPLAGALDDTIASDREVTHASEGAAITGWSVLPTDAGAEFRSGTGSISGTIAYMSPEQAIGEAPAAPSDMFAFGLILQEMLTGEAAFDRSLDRDALLETVRRGETRRPAGLDADLTSLISRLTSFAPSNRPTAVETAERLRWIAGKPARRIRRLAIAAAVLAIVLAAAKYTVDLARERGIAVAARDEADRRRGQAETLIGFMLGNLRPKLQQVGRLDLLEDVGQEATSYFDTVPAGTMSGEELYRRSQAIYQIGQVRQASGKLPEAVAAYRESLAVAGQAAARDSSNAEWQLGVATAHFYLGDALRFQGDLDGAMREFIAYRDIAQSLVERSPHDDKFRLELVYGRSGIAAVHELRGEWSAALKELQPALVIRDELAKAAPDNLERQQALATGLNRTGVVLDRLGDTAGARQHFARDVAIRRDLAARQPRNVALRRQSMVAVQSLGRTYLDEGALTTGLQHYREALAMVTEYAAIDRANADWQRDLGRVQALVADILQWQGNVAEAGRLYASAASILDPLAKAAATNAARQRDLASTEIGLGWLELRRGRAAAAAAHAEAAFGPLAKQTDVASRIVAGESRLLAAEARARGGQQDEARQLREAALALVATNAGTTDKRLLSTSARALLALNRAADARDAVDQLTRIGYRHPAFVQAAAGKPAVGPP
jgi:tetratricopeptide (TPR) repeat protein/tRNA A-37 threonylcarbamoyl transferase component Bud32